MPLTQYACSHCGFWQPWFAGQDPIGCPVCMDVRNALPPDGWDFRTVEDLTGNVTTRWAEAMPGIVGFSCEPAFGLGSTGWLLLREEGNIAFEGAPFYTPEALDEIERLGGIGILAGSHPHGFGALWQLAERFDPTVVIHRDGLRYTKAFRVSWPADDVHALAPGLTMVATQGHYEGHAVLHDAPGRALFCGDCLKVDLDGEGRPVALSCHKGFHYQIPLSHDEIRRYRAVFAELDFDHVFTPFEHAAGVTRAHALGLFDRLLAGAPSTRPLPLESLA